MLRFNQFLLEKSVADSIGNLVTKYHSNVQPGQVDHNGYIEYNHPRLRNVQTVLEPRMFGNYVGSINYMSFRPLGKHNLPDMFAHGLAVITHHMQTNPQVKQVQFTGLTPTHKRLYDRLYQHFEQNDFENHPVLKHFNMAHEDVPEDIGVDNPAAERGISHHKYTIYRKV